MMLPDPFTLLVFGAMILVLVGFMAGTAGALAIAVIGPRRPAFAIIPGIAGTVASVATFGRIGLLGWIAALMAAALLAAIAQRLVLRWFVPASDARASAAGGGTNSPT